MNKKANKKLKQKPRTDAVHPVLRVHKHHLIVKIVEIALFFVLFVCAASLAKAAPINSENLELLINQERSQRGIAALKINQELNQAAYNKSLDMMSKNYFDHYAFGRTPWNFITEQGYDYLYAGENLAMDFQTAEGTVAAWMNSPSHRRNILNSDFSETGIGIVKGEYSDASGIRETQIVTNMFATEKPAVIKFFDTIISGIKSIF